MFSIYLMHIMLLLNKGAMATGYVYGVYMYTYNKVNTMWLVSLLMIQHLN